MSNDNDNDMPLYEPGKVPVPEIGRGGIRWIRVSASQVVKDVLQVTTSFMIGIIFMVWVVFGSQTVSKQNQQILEGVRRQMNAHIEANAKRNCAVAKEIAFLATNPPTVGGPFKVPLTRTARQLNAVRAFEEAACTAAPIPPIEP